MEIENTTPELTQRRCAQFRLKILLIVTGLLLAAVFFSQLSPSVVKKLGPAAETVYDLFNAPTTEPLSLSGQRVVSDVNALGGHAGVVERTPGLFGLLGRKELFSIDFTHVAPAARMSSSAIVSSRSWPRAMGIESGNLPDRHHSDRPGTSCAR